MTNLMNLIVDNSIIFAKVGNPQQRNKNQSNIDPNFSTTFEEIAAFLSVVIFMGIVKLLQIAMYFSQYVYLHQTAVASVFNKHSFFKGKFFHVVGNSSLTRNRNTTLCKQSSLSE